MATWTGSGVWYHDSVSGVWVKLTSAANTAATGDIDRDGMDDLIGAWSSGLWVKYSSTLSCKRIATELPSDIDAGLFRTGLW